MNNEERILSTLEALVAEQQKTNQRLGNLEQGQTKLEQGQTKLEQRQSSLEQEVQEIKAVQLRMEHEHGEKLAVLCDSYKQLYDIAGEVRIDVAAIKSTLDKHDLQIKWMDSQRKVSS